MLVRRLLVLATLMIAVATAAFADKKQDLRTRAEVLFKRADAFRNTTALGPMLLRANVSVRGWGKQITLGTYTMRRSSSTRFRNDFVIGDYGETAVVRDGEEYIVRNAPFQPVAIHKLAIALSQPKLKLGNMETLEIKPRDVGGSPADCVVVGFEGHLNGEWCFNRGTGALVRVDVAHVVTRYSDYAAFGASKLPRKIEISLSGKPLAEATVEEVAVADGFAEDVFAVPAGAKVLGWCDDPKLGRLKQKVTPSYPPADRLRKIQGTVSVFATVGPDGRVQDAAVAQTASPAMDNSAVKAILQWRYEPRTCDGTPVAFEEMVEVNYALR